MTDAVGCSDLVVRSTSSPSRAAHLQIADDDIEVAFMQPLERGVAVAGLLDLVARGASAPAPARAAAHRDRPPPESVPSSSSPRPMRVSLRRFDRQRHPKARAAASRRACQVDAAFVRVDDLAHDGQAEARALRLGREERIEDLSRRSGGMPGPLSATSTTTRRHRLLAVGHERRLVARCEPARRLRRGPCLRAPR